MTESLSEFVQKYAKYYEDNYLCLKLDKRYDNTDDLFKKHNITFFPKPDVHNPQYYLLKFQKNSNYRGFCDVFKVQYPKNDDEFRKILKETKNDPSYKQASNKPTEPPRIPNSKSTPLTDFSPLNNTSMPPPRKNDAWSNLKLEDDFTFHDKWSPSPELPIPYVDYQEGKCCVLGPSKQVEEMRQELISLLKRNGVSVPENTKQFEFVVK